MDQKPRVRDRVTVCCSQCNNTLSVVFRDLIKSTNTHLSIGLDGYYCASCLKTTPAYKEMHRNNSINSKSLIIAGASERSKKLWSDDEYRAKMAANSLHLSESKEFKEKMSRVISEKFKDPQYSNSVKSARKKYWRDLDYRSSKSWSLEQFLKAAAREHGDKYQYHLVDYRNIKTKVAIVCEKHGEFLQRPSHHIFYGNGCPRCSLEIKVSKPQQEIAEWLEGCGYDVSMNDRKRLDGLELDILVPNRNFAIEYHGGFWHSFDVVESASQRARHSRKADVAIQNNVVLMQLFDVEWGAKKELVKSMILHRLGGSSERIYARNCTAVELDGKTANQFCDENHIAGGRYAELYYGLEIGGSLISVVSFKQTNDGFFEVIRFCSQIGVCVVGGLSKMLAASRIGSFMTYADRRYSTANGYLAVGFKKISTTKPGYYYWRNNKLFNRMKFQKHKLNKMLNLFDGSLTEAENMFMNGYRRIWDAGHYKLVKS